MAEVTKTVEEMEDIFRLAILKIFELDPSAKKNQGRVRFPWGSRLGEQDNDLAPITKNDKGKEICVVTIIPRDDSYNRQRHRRHEDRGGRDLVLVDEHTDVHEVTFCNYGKYAYENARKIRDGLFTPDLRRFLKQNNFALVTDVPAIRRVPELLNNEWWNRCDFTAVFNEYVRLESIAGTIEHVNITVKAVINGEETIETITVNRENPEQ